MVAPKDGTTRAEALQKIIDDLEKAGETQIARAEMMLADEKRKERERLEGEFGERG